MADTASSCTATQIRAMFTLALTVAKVRSLIVVEFGFMCRSFPRVLYQNSLSSRASTSGLYSRHNRILIHKFAIQTKA